MYETEKGLRMGGKMQRTNVDDVRSGRLLRKIYVEVKDSLDQCIRDNRRITTDEISPRMASVIEILRRKDVLSPY
jgi:hypothetical protein